MLTVGISVLQRMFTPTQMELLRSAQDNMGIIPTDLIKAHRQAYNGLEKRGYVEGGGLTRTALNYFPLNTITITLADLEFPADGVQGETGPDDSGLFGVIVEPDPSEDDTKPLEPVQPEPDTLLGYERYQSYKKTLQPRPIKTTFTLYQPLELAEVVDAMAKARTREQYERAYRYERATAYRHAIQTDDIPVDIMVMAYESYKARPDPYPEVIMPFIVRTWYKRLLDAQIALSAIPLDDNTGFNNAVLDFKLTKARYMSIAQRFSGEVR